MAQPNIDSLQLPSSTMKSSLPIEDFQSYLKIFINSDHGLYIGDIEVKYWDNIMPTVMNKNLEIGMEEIFRSSIIFYCDKTTKYRFLDKVKEEVARIKKRLFFYKVENFDDTYVQADKIYGTVKEQWAGRIASKGKEYFKYYLGKQKLPSWIENSKPLSNDEMRMNFASYIYDGKVKDVERLLLENPNTYITLLKDKKYAYDGKILSMDDTDMLKKLVESGYILMYRFDYELDYQDYIYFIEKKKNILANKKNLREEFGIIIEISFGLEEKLKEWNLNIFDK